MFKLLLLTAQRRDKAAGAEWFEIDLDNRTWTIPREKAKNDSTNGVHLSHLALQLIGEVPKISPPSRRSQFRAQPLPGDRPVSGFSKAEERLDRKMLELLRAKFEEAGKEPGESRDRGLGHSALIGRADGFPDTKPKVI